MSILRTMYQFKHLAEASKAKAYETLRVRFGEKSNEDLEKLADVNACYFNEDGTRFETSTTVYLQN